MVCEVFKLKSCETQLNSFTCGKSLSIFYACVCVYVSIHFMHTVFFLPTSCNRFHYFCFIINCTVTSLVSGSWQLVCTQWEQEVQIHFIAGRNLCGSALSTMPRLRWHWHSSSKFSLVSGVSGAGSDKHVQRAPRQLGKQCMCSIIIINIIIILWLCCLWLVHTAYLFYTNYIKFWWSTLLVS